MRCLFWSFFHGEKSHRNRTENLYSRTENSIYKKCSGFRNFWRGGHGNMAHPRAEHARADSGVGVDPLDTIATIKQLIHECPVAVVAPTMPDFPRHIPLETQILLFAGKRLLESTRTLFDYNIENESTIHLLLSDMCSGGDKKLSMAAQPPFVWLLPPNTICGAPTSLITGQPSAQLNRRATPWQQPLGHKPLRPPKPRGWRLDTVHCRTAHMWDYSTHVGLPPPVRPSRAAHMWTPGLPAAQVVQHTCGTHMWDYLRVVHIDATQDSLGQQTTRLAHILLTRLTSLLFRTLRPSNTRWDAVVDSKFSINNLESPLKSTCCKRCACVYVSVDLA